jgi:hypothetical protein
MRIAALMSVFTLALAGCGDGSATRGVENTPPVGGTPDLAVAAPPDLGSPVLTPGSDMDHPPAPDDHGDGGMPGILGDGGVFVPPGDGGVAMPGPPIMSGHFTTYGAGVGFRDVSTDQGGGIWGATDHTIYYFSAGKAFTYDQSSGLGQGHTTWTDKYWFGSESSPSTQPVSFTSVAGGMPGEVVVGNIGYIADRLDVDPGTGAVRDVVGLQVTSTQQPNPDELVAQQEREVATWKVVLDLDGTFGGTAYMGGWHGTACFHGMTQPRSSGICGQGCGDYVEHVHAFSDSDTFGGDVHALAITAMGDLWMGDRKALYFMPQRSVGPNADFFQPIAIPGQPNASYIDVFPGVVDDWIFGVAVDGAGGVWVASYGQGLAYLAPGTYAPSYWSTANGLPENYLTGVAVDGHGDVWVATQSSGAARYSPSTHAWSYVTTASGLPSNALRAVYVDPHHAGGSVYFATGNGVAVYAP